jgi:hypothetical protein
MFAGSPVVDMARRVFHPVPPNLYRRAGTICAE